MSDRTSLSPELETALLRELRRFYDWENDYRFRGQLRASVLALADTTRQLGRWISATRTIELSRTFVLSRPWPEVIGVLEHEMAHQYVHEVLGIRDETAHGETFRRVCDEHGIDGRAAGAAHASSLGDVDLDRVLERIRKLLALAGSSNQHEAESAMRRAHELMLRYNLDHVGTSDRFEVRHLGQVRERVSGLESDIVGLISEFFFVKAIRIRTYVPLEAKSGHVYEITGSAPNVAMAEHVFEFLLSTADRLWRENRDDPRVRDGRDRIAYQSGVIGGFREKLLLERMALASTGLVWVGDPSLDAHYRRRHPRVVKHRRGIRWSRAHLAGREAGRNVVLHKPVDNGPTGGRRLLDD
ncbi:MAG: SprT-like domain-containing protein [Kofleriaceae bacterium]